MESVKSIIDFFLKRRKGCLERINNLFFIKKPLIWLEHYPQLIAKMLLLSIFPVILILAINSTAISSNDFYTYRIGLFLSLFIYFGAFMSLSFIRIIQGHFSKYDLMFFHRGKFNTRKERNVLKVNLFIGFLFLFFSFANYIFIEAKTNFPTPKEHNSKYVKKIIHGELYFHEEFETLPQYTELYKSINDSILSKLNFDLYYNYDSNGFEQLTKGYSKIDSVEIISQYTRLLGIDKKIDPEVLKESLISIRQEPETIVAALNRKGVANTNPSYFPLFSLINLIFFGFFLAVFYFGRYTKESLKQILKISPTKWLQTLIALILIVYFLVFIALLLLLALDIFLGINVSEWRKIILKLGNIISYILIIIFDILFIPLFLYTYFLHFPRIKLEHYGKYLSPK